MVQYHHRSLASPIAIVVVDRNDGPVNWKLFKVWTTMTVNLSIEVREYTALKEGIVAKVDTANNMSRLELLDC